VSEWFEEQDEWPIEWRQAAVSGDSFLMATPELLQELGIELVELTQVYRERGNALDPDDENVHRVSIIYHAFPSDHRRV
jgi:hypothetical protein